MRAEIRLRYGESAQANAMAPPVCKSAGSAVASSSSWTALPSWVMLMVFCWPGRCRVEKDPPPCGNCKGSGKITYQRPKKQPDGTVIWVDSIENCDVCGGSGKCS